MKNVLLTGASSGIGQATAKALCDNGFRVMLAARREDRLQELASNLGENAAYCVCDVTNPENLKKAVQATVEKWGQLDVLINNAGLGKLGPLEETSLEDWQLMMDVNVSGVLNGIHAALPQLVENRGHIINTASVAAHGVFPNAVVYCASKHAVAAISQGLRLELRGRVKVTDISPGAVATEFLNHIDHQATLKNYQENAFGGVVLSPEDVATAILDVLQKPEHVVISEVIIRPNA